MTFDVLVEAPSADAVDAERARAARLTARHAGWEGVGGRRGALCRSGARTPDTGLHTDFGPEPLFREWPTLRPRSADGRPSRVRTREAVSDRRRRPDSAPPADAPCSRRRRGRGRGAG